MMMTYKQIPYGGLGFDDFVQAARYLKSRANEEVSMMFLLYLFEYSDIFVIVVVE
jgi:hypothetical protein